MTSLPEILNKRLWILDKKFIFPKLVAFLLL